MRRVREGTISEIFFSSSSFKKPYGSFSMILLLIFFCSKIVAAPEDVITALDPFLIFKKLTTWLVMSVFVSIYFFIPNLFTFSLLKMLCELN